MEWTKEAIEAAEKHLYGERSPEKVRAALDAAVKAQFKEPLWWKTANAANYQQGRAEALEEAAAYIEGKGGLIPGVNAFASLASGNRQPCMSGDGRDRMHPTTRRLFDEATDDLAAAIRALK